MRDPKGGYIFHRTSVYSTGLVNLDTHYFCGSERWGGLRRKFAHSCRLLRPQQSVRVAAG